WSPALSPNRDCSKPGSRLPSPTLKVAGALPVVVSTTSPLGSFRVKCRVTSVSWPIRMMSVMCLSRFALLGPQSPLLPAHYSPSDLQEPAPCGEGLRAGGDAPTKPNRIPSQAALPQPQQYSQTRPISQKPDRTRAGKTDEAYAAQAP